MTQIKVYLCGPINGCTDDEAKGWRAVASEALIERHCVPFDPMVRDYRGREQEPGIARIIVEQDKKDIDECDALLVMFDKPSVGTSMEVIYAADRGRAVHVVNVSGNPLSPWLMYHATEVHDDMGTAIAAIADMEPQYPEYLGECPECGAKESASYDEDGWSCRSCRRHSYCNSGPGGLAMDEYPHWKAEDSFQKAHKDEIERTAEIIGKADKNNTLSNWSLATELIRGGIQLGEPINMDNYYSDY